MVNKVIDLSDLVEENINQKVNKNLAVKNFVISEINVEKINIVQILKNFVEENEEIFKNYIVATNLYLKIIEGL